MPAITRNSARIAGLAGLLFVILTVVAVAILPTSAPDSSSSPAKIFSYYSAHRTTILYGYLLFVLAAVPFYVFIGALFRLMRRAEGERGWWSSAMLGGAAAGGGMVAAGTALLATLAYRPGESAGVLRAFRDAAYILVNFSGAPFFVMFAAVSLAALTTAVLPSWVGWIGLPLGVVNLVGTAALKEGHGAFSPEGAIVVVALVCFLVWTLVVSGALMRAPADAPT